MKLISPVQLLHNPSAGDQAYGKEKLLELLSDEGWNCSYTSSKEDFTIDPDVKMVIVAGGDGTVKKAAEKVAAMDHKPLLAVIPMGTANNIATTLGFNGDVKETIKSWTSTEVEVRVIDTGIIRVGKTDTFFLEGVGSGVFPSLIKKMQNDNHKSGLTGKDSLREALQTMYEISKTNAASYYELEVDGQQWSGNYCMMEVLNITRIGPGLELTPGANLGDGLLDVVLVAEKDRKSLETYLQNKIEADRDISSFPVIRGKEIRFKSQEDNIHIDDKLVKLNKNAAVEIYVRKDTLSFIAKK